MYIFMFHTLHYYINNFIKFHQVIYQSPIVKRLEYLQILMLWQISWKLQFGVSLA